MSKNFDDWHRLKPTLHERDIKAIYFHEREIWYVACGANIGFEQDGKGADFARPVVILRKFNQNIFWGIPLTSRQKSGKYYFEFVYASDKKSMAIISQLRLFDAKRLINRVGMITENNFIQLKQKIKELL